MKNILAMFFVCWILLPAAAGAEQEFTLPQAVRYGLENSSSLKAAEYRTKMADMDIKSARGDFFPQLSTGYTRSRIFSDSSEGQADTDYLDQTQDTINVGLKQILYAGSRLYNTYTAAQAEKEMYQARQEEVKSELVRNIEASFFALMKAKQDVKAAEDTVKRLESSLGQAKAYSDKQIVPYVQVLEARVELESARQELITARNQVEKEKAGLMSVMNIDFATEVKFHGGLEYYPSDYSIQYSSAWKVASENRSDLKAMEKQRQMAEKEAEKQAGYYLPTVSLSAGYYDDKRDYQDPGESFSGTYDRDQQNRYWQASVSLEWKLFDGGKSWYRRQKHLNDIKRISHDIINTENQVKSKLKQAVLAIEEARERIETAENSVEAAEEYYAREKVRFEKQVSTTPALLDAQARLTRTHSEYSKAVFDFQQAVSSLKYVMGTRRVVKFDQS